MQDWMERKAYKIGDFAKKMGVSSHFLKYYEEEGILRPVVKENGYRFYSLYDSSVILECKRLKNMGFSVREVRRLITDSTAEELAEQLAAREAVLAADIVQQQMRLRASQDLRAALKLCDAQEWRIGTGPERWFLPHTVDQEFLPDAGIYAQLEQWMELMPVVCSARRIVRTPDGRWSIQWGLSIRAEDAAQAGLELQAPAFRQPQGRIFEQYAAFSASRGEPSAPGLMQLCLERIGRLNLRADDTFYQQIFCYITVDGERRQYGVLRVPVWEK